MENNLCKICGSERKKIFEKKILEKYDVSYFECFKCGFIQTEKPYWLDEAYSSAITSVDVGLVNRNVQFADVVEKLIYGSFDKKAKFLDLAGGYGLFTRLMRDKGFDFFREDKFCENIFAKYFDLKDIPSEKKHFELITAFEFLEHIFDPFDELDRIFSMTDNFLFSTELIPESGLENWWYLGVEHGQHVSFYTSRSLEIIAERYKRNYYPCGNLHLITGKDDPEIFQKMDKKIWSFKKLKPRILSDFEMARKLAKKI